MLLQNPPGTHGNFPRSIVTYTDLIQTYRSNPDSGILYYLAGAEHDTLIGSCSIDISVLDFGSDAKYRFLEFLGPIMGIEDLEELGVEAKSIYLRGDSITALT